MKMDMTRMVSKRYTNRTRNSILYVKTIILNILLFVSAPILAQNLSGLVIDKITQSPISYANVVLLEKSDSTFIHGTVTNVQGEFKLVDTKVDNYMLRISVLDMRVNTYLIQ